MRVAPAREGLIVRDPRDALPLPMDGREVVWDAYWERRRADGDVVVLPEPAAPGPASAKAAKPAGAAGE